MRSAHYLHEGLRPSQAPLLRLQCPSTRRRCPSLFSSGLHSVEWLLLCLLLTAGFPALCLSAQVASCEAGSQPSPGISQSLPHLSPPHLHHDSPGKYRTLKNLAFSSPSCCVASLRSPLRGSLWLAVSAALRLYVVLVHRCNVLPSPSFRLCLTADALGVRLTLPLAGCVVDLNHQVIAPCRAHHKKGRLRNARRPV